MGLFDLFGSKEERERGALRKLAKRVTERYGPPRTGRRRSSSSARWARPARSTLCLRFTVRGARDHG